MHQPVVVLTVFHTLRVVQSFKALHLGTLIDERIFPAALRMHIYVFTGRRDVQWVQLSGLNVHQCKVVCAVGAQEGADALQIGGDFGKRVGACRPLFF